MRRDLCKLPEKEVHSFLHFVSTNEGRWLLYFSVRPTGKAMIAPHPFLVSDVSLTHGNDAGISGCKHLVLKEEITMSAQTKNMSTSSVGMKPTLGLTGVTINAMALIAPGAFLWTTYQLQAAPA